MAGKYDWPATLNRWEKIELGILDEHISEGMLVTVEISKHQEFVREVAWDFRPLPVWKEIKAEQAYEESDIKLHDIYGVATKGIWCLAESMIPPKGVHRFVDRSGKNITQRTIVDRSDEQVREGQAKDTYSNLCNKFPK